MDGGGVDDEASSSSPIIGASISDGGAAARRLRSGTASSGKISLDYDAVKAAVDAADC